MWKQQLRPAIFMFLIFTLITGVFYPLAVTWMAGLLFPAQSDGSLIRKEGRLAGSRLIGQPFDDPKYFWSRPSATAPFAYNASSSSGSNLGPTNKGLKKAVAERIAALKTADPENSAPVPIDLVTASGSGLDPHISPASALYQVRRVAKARGLEEERVRHQVTEHTQIRQWGVFGEERVNVLELNLAMDDIARNNLTNR